MNPSPPLALAGDTAASEPAQGTGFVAQMRPALVKYFRRKTGSAEEAEDLAQDVLMRALTHAHWTSAAQAKGYIFRAAVNRWRDRRRRQLTHGTHVEWDEALATDIGAENLPERQALAQEELSLVVQALRELSPRTRTVLILVKLEQMKIASVADSIGISVRAVHKHLAMAVTTLAQLRKRKESRS